MAEEPKGLLASVEDLADYIGEPISDTAQVAQANALLGQASSLVRSEAQNPDWGLKDGVEAPEPVFWVVLACAARGYTNFEGFEYESVDDWRAGGRKVEEAGLYLTATERRTLHQFRPAVPLLSTVSTYRETFAPLGGRLVPAEGSPTPIPWY